MTSADVILNLIQMLLAEKDNSRKEKETNEEND